MGKDNVVRRKSLEKLAEKTELPGENDRKKNDSGEEIRITKKEKYRSEKIQ
jgi:hypothetical protein